VHQALLHQEWKTQNSRDVFEVQYNATPAVAVAVAAAAAVVVVGVIQGEKHALIAQLTLCRVAKAGARQIQTLIRAQECWSRRCSLPWLPPRHD
jgi:hypothetical protein